MKFTDDQNKIVDAPVCNLLVSAAAGSGKTTVMVEHIIHLLCDETNPINIDDMLIVTFTEAAAASMKEKINSALLERNQNEPNNKLYKEQLRRLPMAKICTIDSFLLSVVKDNITELPELDSSLRMMDSIEEGLLFNDCLKNCIEMFYQYAEKNPDDEKAKAFLTVMDYFSSSKDDLGTEYPISVIYKKIMDYSSPFTFLEESIQKYNDPLNTYKELLLKKAKALYSNLKKTIKDVEDYFTINANGPDKFCNDYAENIKAVYDLLEKVDLELSKTDLNLYDVFKAFTLKLPGGNIQHKKVFGEGEPSTTYWKSIKDYCNEGVSISHCYENSDVQTEQANLIEALKGLSYIILDLYKVFSLEKSHKNVVSFNDISHYALKLLYEDEKCDRVSATAKAYQNQFKVVFVDEYQDVNDMQNKAIEAVASGNNLFMVGDVKQSIYRFRSSLPELFINKYHAFTNNPKPIEGQDNLLVLNMNFRSHPDILNVTNQFFDYFMNLDGNELIYDDSESLKPGKESKDFSDTHSHVQFVSIDHGENKPKAEDIAVLEAKWVAQDIKNKLDNQFLIYDLHDAPRSIRKNDIVVLARTAKEFGLIAQELENMGIHSIRDKGYGFFEAPELQPILALLKVLDNPYNNVELVSVLHSPFFAYSAQDLADLRLIDPNEVIFYNLLKLGAQSGTKESTKYLNSINKLDEWIQAAKYLSIHDLLVKIFRETDIFLYYKAMPYGNLRINNLNLLLEMSNDFEKTIFNGLYSFIGYLEMNKRSKETLEEASQMPDNMDTVRLMTIHKSKGLEFPLVYLVGFEKGENKSDYNNGILVDRHLGIGVKPKAKKEDENNIYNQVYSWFNEGIQLGALSERECLLYVAMTRAIDTLVLVSHKFPVTKEIRPASDALELQDMDKYDLWFKSYMYDHNVSNMEYTEVSAQDIQDSSNAFTKDSPQTPLKDEKTAQNTSQNDLAWKYSFEKETGLKVRFSVSEVKKTAEVLSVESEESIPEPQNEFFDFQLSDKENTGAKKGTAFHLFVANADFSHLNSEDEINQQINDMVDKGLITREDANEYIDMDSLFVFSNSSLCKRLQKADKIYREQPFILSLTIKELAEICPSWPYLTLGEETTKVMIQGIIDCFFIEKENLVLIDYKTDKELSDARKSMYATQLKIYERALSLGDFAPVTEKALYWSKDGQLYNV